MKMYELFNYLKEDIKERKYSADDFENLLSIILQEYLNEDDSLFKKEIARVMKLYGLDKDKINKFKKEFVDFDLYSLHHTLFNYKSYIRDLLDIYDNNSEDNLHTIPSHLNMHDNVNIKYKDFELISKNLKDDVNYSDIDESITNSLYELDFDNIIEKIINSKNPYLTYKKYCNSTRIIKKVFYKLKPELQQQILTLDHNTLIIICGDIEHENEIKKINIIEPLLNKYSSELDIIRRSSTPYVMQLINNIMKNK